jgi:hypothetical protein
MKIAVQMNRYRLLKRSSGESTGSSPREGNAKKSRGRCGTRPAMHEILFHVTREQPAGVAARKIEKDT